MTERELDHGDRPITLEEIEESERRFPIVVREVYPREPEDLPRPLRGARDLADRIRRGREDA